MHIPLPKWNKKSKPTQPQKKEEKKKEKKPQRGGNIYARTFLSMWTDSISVNYFVQVF